MAKQGRKHLASTQARRTTQRRSPARKKAGSKALAAGLPAVPCDVPEFERVTPRVLAQRVENTVTLIVQTEMATQNARAALGQHLFREWYRNSVRLALDEEAPLPPGMTELHARLGGHHGASAYELRRFLKVAALDAHLARTAWARLSWSVRRELVRLVHSADDLAPLAAGIAFARRKDVTHAQVLAMVNRAVAERRDASAGGRPTGLTVRGSRRLSLVADSLEDDAARKRLVEGLMRLRVAERRALLDDLARTAERIREVVDATLARTRKPAQTT